MPYKHRSDLYLAQKRYRLMVRAKLFDYLLSKSCVDCGEKDPIVLEFDHRDLKDKFKSIANMLSGHYSWKSLEKEIGKCDIRCANCHRKKTYAQFGCFGRSKP